MKEMELQLNETVRIAARELEEVAESIESVIQDSESLFSPRNRSGIKFVSYRREDENTRAI